MRLEALQAISDPTYLAFTDASFRAGLWLDAYLAPERQVHLVGLVRKG